MGQIVKFKRAKRVDVLVQAWRGIDADLVILGDGPLRAALEQQVDELGLRDSIHFAGFVPNASHYLSDADVMIINSDREGFPYTMVEALIARTPVISTNVDAAVEAIPESMRVMRSDSLKLNEKITDFSPIGGTILKSSIRYSIGQARN
jgi:glycosyltransferase involved in cell wall biosynthesis